MVVSSEGYFYSYSIDLENGGECALTKQYSCVSFLSFCSFCSFCSSCSFPPSLPPSLLHLPPVPPSLLAHPPCARARDSLTDPSLVFLFLFLSNTLFCGCAFGRLLDSGDEARNE